MGGPVATNDHLVDVIIPTRNRMALTIEAVESVRAQTFSSWRLFIVDDSSTESVTALERLAKADHRISVLRRPLAGGPQAARQTGFEASTAKLIALLDSDDLWEPTKLDRQVEHFASRESELSGHGAVLCWHQWVDENRHPRSEIRRPVAEGRADPLVSDNMSTLLVSREAVQRAGGFLPADIRSLRVCENVEFYIRLTQACAFSVVPELLVYCRHHAGERASNKLGTRYNAKALAYILARHETVLMRHPEQRAELLARLGIRYLEAGSRRQGLSNLLACTRADGPVTALRILRKYGSHAVKAVVIGR